MNNVEIFKDTLHQAEMFYPFNPDNVKYYNGLKIVEKCAHTPAISVVKGGTVSVGYANADDMQVAILNFADALQCGGLVWVGANTQEENICRCSNLYPTLDNEESHKNYYTPNNEAVNYSGREVYTDRIIYSKDVTVFKDDETYENIEPKKLDVITCPAPNTALKTLTAMQIYVTRIEQIVLSALDNGVDCIVLGAWGCGAFGQDPELVAKSFAYVLNIYGGYFKKIIFAIRPTSGKGDGMYKLFRRILSSDYAGGIRDEK